MDTALPGTYSFRFAEQEASSDTTSGDGASSNTKNPQTPYTRSGQGAQFIFAAATVANILCDNMTQTQINLLANFLEVVVACINAVLTVENPTEIID